MEKKRKAGDAKENSCSCHNIWLGQPVKILNLSRDGGKEGEGKSRN